MDLDEVYEEIRCDPFWDHLRLPGISFVPGFGHTRPKVLLVGEAPGATENRRLRPFCGPSGRVLDQLMALAGLRLEDDHRSVEMAAEGDDPETYQANAFVTNVVKYRPSGNRTPSLVEILHAREGYKQRRMGPNFKEVYDDRLPEGAGSLRREWAALGRPRAIVCVGGVAHSALSPLNYEAVSRHVGRPYVRGNTYIISQFHPAYGLRNRGNPKVTDAIEKAWEDMGKFLREEGII